MIESTAGARARAGTSDEAGASRRIPTQKRSRERVERILEIAKGLIAESGSDYLRMSEVAERAGVSIGSLYQYFPDKGAIIRTLAQRYHEASRACIAEGLAGVGDVASLAEQFGVLFDTYYGMFLAEPVMRDIWSATQADKSLRDIDIADSRENGELLAAAMRRVKPAARAGSLETTAFLVMHLGESTMRLAVSVGRAEGACLVDAYKRMAMRELLSV